MSAHLAPDLTSAPSPPRARTSAGWIVSARWDLLFFFGCGALGLSVGALALARPAWVVPIWWAWLLLLDGPHLIATLWRTAIDAPSRRRWARRNVLALGWLLPGPLCLGLSMVTGSAAPFDLFLLFATLWSIHHAVRQHFGVLSLYHARSGASAGSRRVDRWFIHGSLWWLFGLFLIAHPMNRVVLDLPAAWGPALVTAAQWLGGLLAAAAVAYAATLWRRRRAGEGLKPALFLLLPVLGVQALAYFWIGASEPLHPNPLDPEQYFLAVTAALGVVHSVEYFGVVLLYGERRAARADVEMSGSARALLGRGWLAYGVWVVASALYLVLLGARGNSPGWSIFDPTSDTARLFLALYWGVFFHHYDMDHVIWRPSVDPELRQDLGLSLASPAPNEGASSAPPKRT
jgi:hypothetical protein